MKSSTRTAGFEPESDGGRSLWWLWALLIFLVSVYSFQRVWAAPCAGPPAGTIQAVTASSTDEIHPLPTFAIPDRAAVQGCESCSNRP